MTHKELSFELKRKELLNSNSMPKNIGHKGKLASDLRKMGASMGIKNHDDKQRAQERLDTIRIEEDIKSKKSRTRKAMNNKKAPVDEIDIAVNKIGEDFAPETPSNELPVDYLFDKFKVQVTVFAPSRRRVDPPNFYPTIKHIIDGLTDASWWEDDNFSQLVEMSFRYGGLSDVKDHFVFHLDITSISEEHDYVLTAD